MHRILPSLEFCDSVQGAHRRLLLLGSALASKNFLGTLSGSCPGMGVRMHLKDLARCLTGHRVAGSQARAQFWLHCCRGPASCIHLPVSRRCSGDFVAMYSQKLQSGSQARILHAVANNYSESVIASLAEGQVRLGSKAHRPRSFRARSIFLEARRHARKATVDGIEVCNDKFCTSNRC